MYAHNVQITDKMTRWLHGLGQPRTQGGFRGEELGKGKKEKTTRRVYTYKCRNVCLSPSLCNAPMNVPPYWAVDVYAPLRQLMGIIYMGI